jgi:hypothetical protein
MTKKQKKYIKTWVGVFHSAGLDFETCVFLIGSKMKKAGIPINERNLDMAFEDFQ